ncbi:MAG: adenylyltransferase/cytidyltransferase family protein [Fuerstiella sp.]
MSDSESEQIHPLLLPGPEAPVVVYHGSSPPEVTTALTDVGIFSGSFNPLHQGHQKLCRTAARQLGCQIAYEISVTNVEKAALNANDVRRRLRQFKDQTEERVVLTDAPRFAQKAELFPGCCFVVGFDTAVRIVDARFYNDDPSLVKHCLQRFRDCGISFLVGGRVDLSGRFCDVDALPVSGPFRSLFIGLTECQFREDISSTQLRHASDDGRSEP